MSQNYIEWIGTGSGLNPVLGNTSFMVRGTNRTLLVDCGVTIPLELMKSGQLGEITDVLLTHPHADHIGGLEALGFTNYFALRRREENRPNLYVASRVFANNLWEHSLRGGMEHETDDKGNPMTASLDTYFKVNIGKEIDILGFPKIVLFETPHIPYLENYGVQIGDVYYSGDSTLLPPDYPRLIFQDCQFFESTNDVHIPYAKLNRELSPEVKAKTYLVHLGEGLDKIDTKRDGFAGIVKPKDRFLL